ncbi:MAG: hypothetical protein ACM3SW_04790 [Actinomycetota bacterium]
MKTEMQVVWHAANRNRNEIDVLAYARDIFPEARLKIFCDQLLPLPGAEYRMQMVLGEGIAPAGACLLLTRFPTSHEVGYNIPSLPRLAHWRASATILGVHSRRTLLSSGFL